MDYDKILRDHTNDLGVTILFQTEEVDDELQVLVRVHATKINFWSDWVKTLRGASFQLNGSTGEVLKGSQHIKRVAKIHEANALPWPDSDDPHCSSTSSCMLYLSRRGFGRATAKEVRAFIAAGMGRREAYIVVKDYPSS